MKRIPRAWIETEAMMVARRLVRDSLKEHGLRLSHVGARQVSQAAKALLEHQPDIRKAVKRKLQRKWS